MHSSKNNTITSLKHICLQEIYINFCHQVVLSVLTTLSSSVFQNSAIFSVIPQYITVQVMWKVPVWGLTSQLPQQTIIVRTASQGVFTECSSFQIVTAKFTPFLRLNLQLDHPVTYSRIQIIAWIKSYNYIFNNLLPLIVLQKQ